MPVDGKPIMIVGTEWFQSSVVGTESCGWRLTRTIRPSSRRRTFSDPGIDHDLNTKPQPLNADATNFRFRVKWHGKTVILRYSYLADDDKAATFAGHSCRFMGTRYDDEVRKYNGCNDHGATTTEPGVQRC
jgi:hypothetical protein